MKTMTEKAMTKAAEKLGVKIVTLQCSGYVRLQVLNHNVTVETTNMSIGEARAEIVRLAKGLVK